LYNFNYIIDKINSAEFEIEPFKHVYIEDFLSEEHFNHIINLEQINLPKFETTKDLCNMLLEKKYNPVSFPGCTTDIEKYLLHHEFKEQIKYKTPELTEGVGISFRLSEYEDDLLKSLIQFLNSSLFLDTLKNKFNKKGKVAVETAVQKYVDGYEISPHPDIRRKCLTYMVNINPSNNSENINYHTHYMKLKDEYSEIYNFWKNETDTDRCWIPWSWAYTVKRQTKNNSIVIFAPDYDTLHAVKADYNHLKTQRTQFYGNLWYAPNKISRTEYTELSTKLSLPRS
jgi:hypothetical protein